jgi:heme exporter protein B
MSVFALLVAREARLLFRRPAELANPLVFFAIVIALFPLAVGPETQLLQTLSPGLVWVAAFVRPALAGRAVSQ